MSSLLDTLANIVGSTNLLPARAAAERARNHWDNTPLQAKALVRPANTQQVSQVLAACHGCEQSVVTHGGVTGLADGDYSTGSDIVLSLERMNQLEPVDATGRTITVQAGCVLQDVQQAAVDAGLMLGLDLGARGSCTIGGNIATNAGGLSVLRYGMTREQVLGLEVVMADGTVINSMNSMLKNNAGYDIKQNFIGSEGTLGVITRAVLRLRAATPSTNTAMLAFENYQQVTRTLAFLSEHLGGQLNAFEVLWDRFYKLNTDNTLKGSVRAPLSGNYTLYAIVESCGNDHESDKQRFEQALGQAMEQGLFIDAMIPQSEQERADTWVIRENVDIMLRHTPCFSYDISLPIASMQDYLDEVEPAIRMQWPDADFFVYGHVADGNLHVSVVPEPANYDKSPASDTNTQQQHAQWNLQCNDIVFTPLQALGGSISAEHGIGLLKKPYLSLSRNAAELALMRTLKHSLDPKGILNPGKII